MCDFDSLLYQLKNELLNIYKEAEVPQPRIKITSLSSGRLCGLANLAKLILYLEREGYITVTNKDDSYQNWEIQIEAGILDLLFGYS